MSQPIITLITDFGSADHYVAAMKGVILGITPRARIVDITHDVAPFAIAQGAYLLAQTYAHFPKHSIHVAVVDPGVGSERRAIALEAAGQTFIGPDNGIFSFITSREKHKARLITNEKYFHHPVSRTFHGRDIFAPSAAHLAAGASFSSLGKRIRDFVTLDLSAPQVLHTDHFGNIITNLRAADLETHASLTIAGVAITEKAENYAQMQQGKLYLIEGSSGYLEISMHQASAAGKIAAAAGMPVEIKSQPRSRKPVTKAE
jgi:hypothetical protein